jgi:glycolate oxidase FAD binding subunit
MTVTVDAAMTLAGLQTALAKGGQWLPIDPPSPGELTIADLLARNLSGPRRFGYGTVRDYVIGMKVRLADERIIKTGGKVVKNVAGYDLQKLFIGAEHSLGAILEATFKLRPVSGTGKFVQKSCSTLAEAGTLITSVLDSSLAPTVLDLHNVNATSPVLVIGFDGTQEEVDWQLARARELGIADPSSLDYEKTFWAESKAVNKISVLPSKLIEFIGQTHGPFVARAGNGILYSPDAAKSAELNLPTHLWQRVRDVFDPQGKLRPLPL